MANKSKARGTKFETDLVGYLKERGHEARRIALAGKDDCGDVYAEIGDRRFVIECKSYSPPKDNDGKKKKAGWYYTEENERKWREQAITERNNYQEREGDQKSYIALLILHQYGKGIERSIVHFWCDYLSWYGWHMMYLSEFVANIDRKYGDKEFE